MMRKFGYILLILVAGCVGTGNKAKLEVTGKGQESGRDTVNRGGTVENQTSPANTVTTTQPVTVIASGSGHTVTETSTPTGQHTNTGALIVQYAPVIAGSVGGVFMWLLFRHLSDKLTRKCEIEMKRLDLEGDKYVLSTVAAMAGHSVPEPHPTPTNVEPVK